MAEEVFVADGAIIREDTIIGARTIIGAGVIVENQCRIGAAVKVETRAYIVCGTVIEDRCFIGPLVGMANDRFLGRTEERFKQMRGPHIRRGARVGLGARLLPGITIGEEAVVGAGAVVTTDVPSCQTVMGVPARVAHAVPETQLLKHCLPDVWAAMNGGAAGGA